MRTLSVTVKAPHERSETRAAVAARHLIGYRLDVKRVSGVSDDNVTLVVATDHTPDQVRASRYVIGVESA